MPAGDTLLLGHLRQIFGCVIAKRCCRDQDVYLQYARRRDAAGSRIHLFRGLSVVRDRVVIRSFTHSAVRDRRRSLREHVAASCSATAGREGVNPCQSLRNRQLRRRSTERKACADPTVSPLVRMRLSISQSTIGYRMGVVPDNPTAGISSIRTILVEKSVIRNEQATRQRVIGSGVCAINHSQARF